MSELKTRLYELADTRRMAEAAYCTWLQIVADGYQAVAAATPKPTFRRHRALLKKAGLSDADIRTAQVIPLRRRAIDLCGPVHSFEALRLAA